MAPRSEAEKVIGELWSELLELTEVGVHEDFVELGGDSLIAARLVTRVNQRFQTDLSIREAFERNTIALLAELLENVLIAEIDSLSDEEVERLMKKGDE